MKNETTAGLMKISELAEASGTNVSTLKFYVKEGLILPECKTGPNMAYYSPDCVARIKTIRRLQKERFYPLSVIKQLLCSPGFNLNEMEMLNAIYKVGYESAQRQFSIAEASKTSRLSHGDIERVIKAGLIVASNEGRKRMLSDDDLGTLLLLKKRMDAGIPLEQSITAFATYSRALEQAAAEDVDGFITGALMKTRPSADQGARMIRTSDETIDAFISIKRSHFNRRFGAVRVNDLEAFSNRLKCVLNGLERALARAGLNGEAERCRRAADGDPGSGGEASVALKAYVSLTKDCPSDVASGIAACMEAREYFCEVCARKKADEQASLMEFSLALCWLHLAPSIISAGDAAKSSAALAEVASRFIGGKSKKYADAVLNMITELGGNL